jgi:hypothetical protein
MSSAVKNRYLFLVVLALLVGLLLLPASSHPAFAKKPVKPTPTPAPEPDPEIVYLHNAKSGNVSRSEIAVMNADGSNQMTVVDCGTYSCTWPDWSPDGTQIIFVSNAFDLSDPPYSEAIYVVDLDGSNLQKMVDLRGGRGQPAWSPVPIGGQYWIVYSDETPSNPCGGYHDLYAYGVSDGAVQQLTYFEDVTVDEPAWSADGAFLSARHQWDLHPWHVYNFVFQVEEVTTGGESLPALGPWLDTDQWKYNHWYYMDDDDAENDNCGFWSTDWSNGPGPYMMLGMCGLEVTFRLDFQAGYPYPDEDGIIPLEGPPVDLRQQVPDDFLPLYVQYGRFSPDNTRFVFQGMVRVPVLKATGIYTASTDNSGPVVELAKVGITQGSYEMPEWRPAH